MSGEITFSPIAVGGDAGDAAIAAAGLVVLGGGLVIGGGVLAASVAARSIMAFVDGRVEAAERKVEAERRYAAECQAFRKRQQSRMAQLREVQAAIEACSTALCSTALGNAHGGRSAGTERTDGFMIMSTGRREAAETAAMLAEIAAVLDELDAPAAKLPQFPLETFRTMHQALSARQIEAGVSREEVDNLRTTLTHTLKSHHNKCQQQALAYTDLVHRVEQMLRDAMVLTEAAVSENVTGKSLGTLRALCEEIERVMREGHLTPSAAELIEKSLQTVRNEVQVALGERAHRQVLADSITARLETLGYRLAEPFSPSGPRAQSAVFDGPEGGRLRAVVHHSNQIGFELEHDGMPGDLRHAPSRVLAYRSQEKRWCSDAKQLLRGLLEDGFCYRIGFERLADIDAVVVETAQEIESRGVSERDATDEAERVARNRLDSGRRTSLRKETP